MSQQSLMRDAGDANAGPGEVGMRGTDEASVRLTMARGKWWWHWWVVSWR